MTDVDFDLSLADFYMGDDIDPFRVPEGFSEWRKASSEYQSLYERCLLSASAAHSTLKSDNGSQKVVNMASLDYLGLCSHPKLISIQQEALSHWGNGAGGVPLLSGMTIVHKALEEKIAELTKQQSSLLFSSGFSAATGLAIALLRKSDIAVCDEKAHISWVDGVKMSGASLLTFSHNDSNELDRILGQYKDRRRVVIVDGVYSMDGDFANLPDILDVTEKHGVGLIVDEAHSIFAAGKQGGGAVEHFSVQDRVQVVMGTFSKALGFVGGFLSAEKSLIDYMRYYSHPYTFSSALPPALVTGILAGIELSISSTDLRTRLWNNANYFRSGLQTLGLDIGDSQSWVVPIILHKDRKFLYDSVKSLGEKGLYVAPVDYPAVSENKIRIRTAVSSAHSIDDLDFALNVIEEVILK